jgi:hypothetical protein
MKRHRLRKRYGRAASKGLRVVYRMPTGGMVWQVPNSTLQIMWPGPGGGLSLGRPMEVGGATNRIEHYTANGNYYNVKDAARAAKAFTEAT